VSKSKREHVEQAFERGVQLFRDHDYAGALALWSRLMDDGFEHPNIELYVTVARKEDQRVCRFVESYATDIDRAFADFDSGSVQPVVQACDGHLAGARSFIKSGQYVEALGEFEAIIAGGESGFYAYLGAARMCLMVGRFQKALEYADLAGRAQPENSRAYGVLGSIQLELGADSSAEALFQRSIELDEGNASSWYGLASLCFEDKRYGLAESCLRKVLRLKPGWISASSLLDDVERGIGETERLVEGYRAAIAAHPEYADQHHKLGVCLTYKASYEEAIACFDQALAINPNLVKTLVQRGHVLAVNGRYEGACDDYRRAIEMHCEYDPAVYQEALGLETNKQFEAAAERYAEALLLTPNFASGHIATGRKFFEIGLLEQAEREIRKGVRISPRYADGYCMLGHIAVAREDIERAVEMFSKALVLNPLYEEAARGLVSVLDELDDMEEIERVLAAWDRAGRTRPDLSSKDKT